AVAVAHGLAVEQHRRLVLLALADHDGAVHADGVHEGAHRVDRGAVGPVLVAGADPAAAGDGGGFGHADQLEGEVAVRGGGGGGRAGHGGSSVRGRGWSRGPGPAESTGRSLPDVRLRLYPTARPPRPGSSGSTRPCGRTGAAQRVSTCSAFPLRELS